MGKTTLIHNLVKHFAKQPLATIKGPVTVVIGKKLRMTIIECNNDINSMIDLAKVADLVLLLVDASFGFEMEIFEFLNICQVIFSFSLSDQLFIDINLINVVTDSWHAKSLRGFNTFGFIKK